MTKQSYTSLFTLTIFSNYMSPVKNFHRQLVLSRDHFSNYLNQHDEKTLFLQNCFIEVHKVNVIKESKFKVVARAEVLPRDFLQTRGKYYL